MTKIEWTDATWNFIVGCTVQSAGCTNCYAMRMAHRLAHNPAAPQYAGTVKVVNRNPVWTGKIGFSETALIKPLQRRKPTRYFVNSMGDMFHPNVPDDLIDRGFAVMALCPQHTFQILTKHPERMREYVAAAQKRVMDEVCDMKFEYDTPGSLSAEPKCDEMAAMFGRPVIRLYQWPLPNVHLGVSVEDQGTANTRIPPLLRTPAAARFVSAEPLLGPVFLKLLSTGPGDYPGSRVVGDTVDALTGERVTGTATGYNFGGPHWPKLDQIIVGGESGRGARPMHPDWPRQIRDDCEAAGTAFFFKQWGRWLHESQDPDGMWDWGDASDRGILHIWDDDHSASIPLTKAEAGRLLDGREWNGVVA